MKNLLDKGDALKPVQIGKIIEGKVVGKARSTVFLDLGPIGTGIIYGREFQNMKDEIKKLSIGSSLFAKIIDLDNEDGYIELSLSQASDELTWKKLKELREKEEIVKIKVVGANKGGLTTEVFGIPAFLPVSQLMPENYPRVEKGEAAKIEEALQKLVDQELEVKIFDLDSRRGKLILSEKAKDGERMKELLKNYQVGDIVKVKITGLTDFGAFVRFVAENDSASYIEGLIHISELDWHLVENPEDIVKVDEEVEAKIISITDNKIALSLKALKENPWKNIEKEYKAGDIIEGKVVKLNPFGAFIQVKPKIQGLCHISEFGTKEAMEKALEINKHYKFEISIIDLAELRMILKLVKE